MVKVITYNLEYGAEGYGVEKAAEIIINSKAEVALLQETKSITSTLAKYLGWYFLLFEESETAILSVKPIEKIYEGRNFGVGQIGKIYYCVIHLPHYPYIAFEAAGINYPSDCVECFQSADPEILIKRSFEKRKATFRELIKVFSQLPPRAKIIVGGDFNEPSHLDWTIEEEKRGTIPFAVEFPSTKLMEMLGFTDSFRKINPSLPGHTWPDREVDYENRSDRIDFIFTKNMKILNSVVIKTGVSDHCVVKTIVS